MCYRGSIVPYVGLHLAVHICSTKQEFNSEEKVQELILNVLNYEMKNMREL